MQDIADLHESVFATSLILVHFSTCTIGRVSHQLPLSPPPPLFSCRLEMQRRGYPKGVRQQWMGGGGGGGGGGRGGGGRGGGGTQIGMVLYAVHVRWWSHEQRGSALSLSVSPSLPPSPGSCTLVYKMLSDKSTCQNKMPNFTFPLEGGMCFPKKKKEKYNQSSLKATCCCSMGVCPLFFSFSLPLSPPLCFCGWKVLFSFSLSWYRGSLTFFAALLYVVCG